MLGYCLVPRRATLHIPSAQALKDHRLEKQRRVFLQKAVVPADEDGGYQEVTDLVYSYSPVRRLIPSGPLKYIVCRYGRPAVFSPENVLVAHCSYHSQHATPVSGSAAAL